MRAEDVRALLGQTGPLYTRDPEDVGHISDRWRKVIVAFCDLIDAAPLDTAEQLRETQQQVAGLAAEVERLEGAVSYLVGQAEASRDEALRGQHRASEAVLLVEQAIPRMRTLNNQMSPGWLARAGEFLEGN